MARNSRLIRNSEPADVFAVLRDGWSYGDWVVGTRMIREVDPGWPAPGTRIHYTIGRWPLRKDDVTTSRGYEPERRLELEAQAWPTGTVRIMISAEPADDGTLVTLSESPARGLLKLVDNPVLDLGIKLRNVETLRRLESQVRRKQRDRLRPAPG